MWRDETGMYASYFNWQKESFQSINNWPRRKNPTQPEPRMHYALLLPLTASRHTGSLLRLDETVNVYLANIFGEMLERTIAWVFVDRLPDLVKRHLHSSSRMDTLPIEELLAWTRAIMDESTVAEPVIAAAQPTQRVLSTIDVMDPTIWQGTACRRDKRFAFAATAATKISHKTSVSFPAKVGIRQLPIVTDYNDGIPCSDFLDTGCSRSGQIRTWRWPQLLEIHGLVLWGLAWKPAKLPQ